MSPATSSTGRVLSELADGFAGAQQMAVVGSDLGRSSYKVHRWYEHGTGRYTRTDPLGLEGGDLFQSNLHYAYANSNPLVGFDPLGLYVLVCSRRTHLWVGPFGPFGNHNYFWDDRPNIPHNKRFCGRGPTNYERGPRFYNEAGDYCYFIPGSDQREDELMDCCRKARKDPGPWAPPFSDCRTMLKDCVEDAGLVFMAPGGRTGPPCDVCDSAPDPMSP